MRKAFTPRDFNNYLTMQNILYTTGHVLDAVLKMLGYIHLACQINILDFIWISCTTIKFMTTLVCNMIFPFSAERPFEEEIVETPAVCNR